MVSLIGCTAIFFFLFFPPVITQMTCVMRCSDVQHRELPVFPTVNSIAKLHGVIKRYNTGLNYSIHLVFFKEQNLELKHVPLILWMLTVSSAECRRTSSLCSYNVVCCVCQYNGMLRRSDMSQTSIWSRLHSLVPCWRSFTMVSVLSEA